MLHSAKEMMGMSIAASDGELGSIDDLYFDDEQWTIRYLVVDTGGWIGGRDVLIPLHALSGTDWIDNVVRVNLTKEQVKGSPSIDSAKPVSRQNETDLHNHYGYPYYWSGPRLWGATVFPGVLETNPYDAERYEDLNRLPRQEHVARETSHSNSHLRSYNEITSYAIDATDDTVGHVEDFLLDDKNWSIQLISVDTGNWLPGKTVLLSPQRIERVSWSEKKVIVNLAKDEVEGSPEFDPANPPPFGPKYDLFRRFGMPHG